MIREAVTVLVAGLVFFLGLIAFWVLLIAYAPQVPTLP